MRGALASAGAAGLALAALLAACHAGRAPAPEGSSADAPRAQSAEPTRAREGPQDGASAPAGPAVRFTDEELQRVLRLSPLPPVPDDTTNAYDTSPQAAELGRRLFFDAGLSADGRTSCATCHVPELSFTDGRALGRGVSELPRNTQALWNVGHNRWFFWDGRKDSLWSQALAPLEDEREHALDRVAVLRHLADTPELAAAYEALFGPLPDVRDRRRFPRNARPVPYDPDHPHDLANPPPPEHEHPPHPHDLAWQRIPPADRRAVDTAFANVGKALAAHVRRLVSDRAPFDVFVEGLREGDAEKLAALTPAAQRGLKLFVGRGQCDVCHAGPNLTNREFHAVGVPPLRDDLPPDPGRERGLRQVRADPFNGLGPHSDDPDGAGLEKVGFLPIGSHSHAKGEFKVPTLRNVARTAPYMHQGQLADLEAVVDFYSTEAGAGVRGERILRPLNLGAREAADLVAFLESLTDEDVDPELLRAPGTAPADER